ncbi:hypothetical protein [Streptomyces sp. NPDC015130]|uniref:hypothetical protein n=1 Tax=Streptomyces sp. NPDC015130 TaxID=3364940 RepID=UPI0036F51C92
MKLLPALPLAGVSEAFGDVEPGAVVGPGAGAGVGDDGFGVDEVLLPAVEPLPVPALVVGVGPLCVPVEPCGVRALLGPVVDVPLPWVGF